MAPPLLTVEEARRQILSRVRALPGETVPLASAVGRVLAEEARAAVDLPPFPSSDRKSTRLNSSHMSISYAVFCLKKKKQTNTIHTATRARHVGGHYRYHGVGYTGSGEITPHLGPAMPCILANGRHGRHIDDVEPC